MPDRWIIQTARGHKAYSTHSTYDSFFEAVVAYNELTGRRRLLRPSHLQDGAPVVILRDAA